MCTIWYMIVTRHTTAPPEAVWPPMSDVTGWPTMTASMDRVEMLTDGPLAVGSRYRAEQPTLRPMEWEVTALEPGRSFTSVTRNGGVTTTAVHTVEAQADGALITLSLEHTGLLAGLARLLTDKRSREYIEMEAAGAAAAAEAASTR